MIPAKISRFSPIIESEIKRHNYPFPPELIMAVIWVESRGSIGAVNAISGASGLMQIMPVALADYNARSGQTKLSMETMRSKAETSAHDQIKVGMWLLAQFWRGAYRYLRKRVEVTSNDLIRIADTFYAAGPGRMKELIDKVKIPTWQGILDRYPTSNALGHATKVWNIANQYGAHFSPSKIFGWLSGSNDNQIDTVDNDVVNPIDGAIWGLILIGLFWWVYSQGKKS